MRGQLLRPVGLADMHSSAQSAVNVAGHVRHTLSAGLRQAQVPVDDLVALRSPTIARAGRSAAAPGRPERDHRVPARPPRSGNPGDGSKRAWSAMVVGAWRCCPLEADATARHLPAGRLRMGVVCGSCYRGVDSSRGGFSVAHHGRSAVRLAKVARLPVVGAVTLGRAVTRHRSGSFRGLAPYRSAWALLTHSPCRVGCLGGDARADGVFVTWLARSRVVCWCLLGHGACIRCSTVCCTHLCSQSVCSGAPGCGVGHAEAFE